MTEEKTYTKEDLLDLLIGHTSFWGETNYDDESLANLDVLDMVSTNISVRLYQLSKETKDRPEGSAAELKHRAWRLLTRCSIHFWKHGHG
ncbi:hypothetical protein [Furfurilactobacillus rossiae]|uniref:Uncharacterized protein n=1 Tax=Furfurilactobacillus rossiae DSM 15814 TaxID=1114972 RepID=A0A0R1RIR3_9LACO|nr:hypothetical protein [Furfurilactobacillus rossiae]KRL56647.1 hypothetical protein FD35_GL001744 [Furfurilactobacillus rossiae DSM 15814]QFR66452.1 hypothetical protein LR814_04800 [Furfurilactobacillus rossiae]QLE61910.1 hypothetical protein LROSRS0_1865 [Furfurilactobacillus rossiae]